MCQGLFLGWDSMTSGCGMGPLGSLQTAVTPRHNPAQAQRQAGNTELAHRKKHICSQLGLLPLVLICSGSVDKSGKAYFLVSFTVMWNPIAVSGWEVHFCLLSRGRKGGSGSCGGLAADERSAVSGRAGHLITEWVLLHHSQSHTGSHLPSILASLCCRDGDMATQGHWKQQSCILRPFLPF
ncbi:uncharacterized [Tachysurus ichikawai]